MHKYGIRMIQSKSYSKATSTNSISISGLAASCLMRARVFG